MSTEQPSKKDFWNPSFYKEFKGFASITPLWKTLLGQYHQDWPSIADYNSFTNILALSAEICFIEQLSNMRYLWEIYHHRTIPTRTANWHDFFNNLTWLAFPKLKRAIVDKMCQSSFSNKSRTPLQNTLAHFDECGMVICSDKPAHFELIKNFEWTALFCETQGLQQHCLPVMVGHGLMEKGLSPYIGMTAKAVFLEVESSFFNMTVQVQNQFLDEKIAAYVLSDEFPHLPKALQPFPMLGWPTWHHNQDEVFYQNHSYFRPKRIIL